MSEKKLKWEKKSFGSRAKMAIKATEDFVVLEIHDPGPRQQPAFFLWSARTQSKATSLPALKEGVVSITGFSLTLVSARTQVLRAAYRLGRTYRS